RQPEGHLTQAQWNDLADQSQSRALVFQARATGNSGSPEEATRIAARAWDLYPHADAAREAARWLLKLGKKQEAADRYAEAFAVSEPSNAGAERAQDRARIADLYRQVHGSSQGEGDMMLQAFDRVALVQQARTARYRNLDPNYGVTDIFGFQLPGKGT